ncbi:hypothetical protein QFZ37_000105 [Chryseobacterium ginsenosidimutans]|uniref:hypothetical protein n=1 Tax=Chryseobacterium ginsenosidimutans TaxID=687846 RepID=UPI0027847E90|nr:hypothetical protein [Chryseobacterium ginsenosidimutans]MDQ0591736.1 hypothetical protein [Chryseobacterium ginsenosidimutans]
MKKFLPILLLAFVSLFIFSCDNNDDNTPYQDNDTIAQMKDATGTFNSGNNFKLTMDINILNTDVVLVYRKVGNVWQSVPKTYYLDNAQNLPTGRELDYNFDFNTSEVNITTTANFNQSTQMTSGETTQYLNNQTFRVVLVPANAGKNSAVNYEDYNSVIKYYNIDESKVNTIKFK